ncbi:HAD family phosphatase [Henriciella sp.]|uniref:HAD family hydrolase n=1 Tax=Henriciella sp. TaxID=1968823 RepID=UPI00262120DF|nr:HAD family phosphatase [Henriciella sp.]
MAERIILFDLGNVVVDWDPVYLYRKVFDSEDEARRFCGEVCTMAWHVEHDRGRSFAEGARQLKALHPEYAAEIDAWHGRWFEMFDGYVDGVPELIKRLDEAQYPLYGLSNISHEIWPGMLEHFPLIRRLRDVVVSGEERLIKPDPAIYEIALNRMGNPDPAQVFFIDDSEKNIEAARRLGFRGHHFRCAGELEAALVSEEIL